MKIKIVSCVIAALFLFSSASIWEGSAAIASDGYLPGKGLYAATNSFPRNTVIEITNLENNKSIRVIVAEGLDSSGLLALVSQDAAEWLGMNRDSISRIRMTQPSDPIAYKRFTDGMAAGFPDYDSGAVVTENQPYAQTPFPALSGPPKGAPAVAGSILPPVFLEEEWGGKREIEELPKYYTREEIPYNGSPAADTWPVYELIPDNERVTVYELIPDDDRSPVYELIPEIAENNFEPEQKQASAQISETVKEPVKRENEKLEYSIIAAKERPPETPSNYGIDPDYIIPGIAAEERQPETPKTYDIDLDYIIPGITRPSPAEIHPEKIEIPVIAKIPAQPPARSFTINQISMLDKGSYYVQIASLQERELVESALDRIDADYKPVVFKDGGNWYRILLGPLNQGESGAILQRFKSIGYKDSFIRQGK